MDFAHDQLETGRKIRILMIVDGFSRFWPVIDPRFTYRSGKWSRRWIGPAPGWLR